MSTNEHESTQTAASAPETVAAISPHASPKKKRRGRGKTVPTHPYERPAMPVLMTIPEAADALRCSIAALRQRCRRAAVKGSDGNVVAQLAPGVVAVKFGRNTWRVRFDNAK